MTQRTFAYLCFVAAFALTIALIVKARSDVVQGFTVLLVVPCGVRVRVVSDPVRG